MTKTTMLNAAVMAAWGANMALATTELVTNGGFETGNFTGWSDNNPGNPWYFGVGAGAHTGSFAVGYGATDGIPDSITQLIPTTIGVSYHYEFWLQADGGGGGGQTFFEATVGGVAVLSLADDAPFGYTQFSGNFVATDTSTALVFSGFNAPAYYYLDDVSVTEASPVPEASTTGSIALLGGLVGFACWQRRRQP